MEAKLRKGGILVSPHLRAHELYELGLLFGLEDTVPTRNKQVGILGWDIDYEPATWVTDIVGNDWNPRFNPLLLPDGTWMHHSDIVGANYINKALRIIRNAKKEGRYRWKSVLPSLIEVGDEPVEAAPFGQLILTPEYNVAMVGWDGHMRFVYKEKGNHLAFFDPWMDNVGQQPIFRDLETKLEQEYGSSTTFLQRNPDQSDENSCVIDSLARCILVAEYGEESAFWPWDLRTFDYALLAARVIHMVVR